MYTQNLVLFTQEIMYGESITSFSNFKGLLKHRKNAGLFIHCGVVAKSIQTIAISLLFLQKCRFLHKKRKGQLWGILRPPRTKLWSFFFVYYGNLDFFWQLLPTSCIVGVWFWPMKLQQTLSLLVDLNLNPLVWSVVMQIKLQPLVWNWRESFSQPIETVERLNQLAVLWFMH